MVDMEESDLQVFAERAKKFGLTFAVVSEDKSNHVIFKEEDTPFMKKVLEITIEKKLERQKDIESEENLKQFIENLKSRQKKEQNLKSEPETEQNSENLESDTKPVEEPAAETNAGEKETAITNNQTDEQTEVVNKKLATEQFAADKKDVDIPNNEITVKSHLEKNEDNKKKKDLGEKKDTRISIREELAKTHIPTEQKKNNAPTKTKSVKENVRG